MVAVEVLGDIAPPLGQGTKGVGRVVALPVELGRDIVDGALLEPRQRVAEERGVLPVAASGARVYAMLRGTCCRRSCHTGGSYGKAHLRLHLLHHVIHVGNHLVDLRAAPVGKAQAGAAVLPQRVVGSAAVGGYSAGIKVVVEDDAIDVVVLNHLAAHVHDALTRGGQAGVEHCGGGSRTVGIGEQDTRVAQRLVLRGVPGAWAAVGITVGVHPGMALDAPLVALLHGKRQWVPAGIGATGASEVTRPRLVARLVHRVAHRAHLNAHGIHVGAGKAVKVVNQGLFLAGNNACRGAALARPVNVGHCGEPCGTHLALLLLGTHHSGQHERQRQNNKF